MRRRVGRGTRVLAAFVGTALIAVTVATVGERNGQGTLEMVIAAAFCFILAWTGFDLQGGSERTRNRRFGQYGAMLRRRLTRR